MARMKLAMLAVAALCSGPVLAGDGQGPRPPAPYDPCAVFYRGQVVAPPTPRPAVSEFSGQSTSLPAPAPSRIPSIYSRDYTPHAPAWPRPEPAPPPRDRPLGEQAAAPAASTSGQYYQAYYAAPEESRLRQVGDGSRSVCFWNLSPQAVTLRVLDRAHVLERGKSLVLELPRQFTWQLDGRAPETSELPEDRIAMEIVIRR